MRAALGQRELDDGRSEPLKADDVPIVRRRAVWMVLAAAAIGVLGAAIVYVA